MTLRALSLKADEKIFVAVRYSTEGGESTGFGSAIPSSNACSNCRNAAISSSATNLGQLLVSFQDRLPELTLREHAQVFFQRVGDTMIRYDLAVLHAQDAFRRLRNAPVVGDNNDRGLLAAIQLGKQRKNLLATLAVERAAWVRRPGSATVHWPRSALWLRAGAVPRKAG